MVGAGRESRDLAQVRLRSQQRRVAQGMRPSNAAVRSCSQRCSQSTGWARASLAVSTAAAVSSTAVMLGCNRVATYCWRKGRRAIGGQRQRPAPRELRFACTAMLKAGRRRCQRHGSGCGAWAKSKRRRWVISTTLRFGGFFQHFLAGSTKTTCCPARCEDKRQTNHRRTILMTSSLRTVKPRPLRDGEIGMRTCAKSAATAQYAYGGGGGRTSRACTKY